MTRTGLHREIGRRVILEESRALSRLAEHLDGAFDTAVEMMLATRGRVIVTGIGKSGHVARKIAATLASTGTPAHFVHPAEASHGDLGMIQGEDVVLAVSYSGEAPELANLVAYTHRFRIPLIAISGNPESTLISQARIGLILPGVGEACGQGVVPTNSTTMTLALGDAIAIALMQAREFTTEHFREFHPGGNLGARLARVSDLMHRDDARPVVHVDTPMSEALLIMSQKGFGVVGVVDPQDRLLGVITDGDLRRHMSNLLDNVAGDVMTRTPRTIEPGALAEDAVAIMNEAKITCLFVVDRQGAARVDGILHIHDCLRAGVV